MGMKAITVFYILNATLLILHEMESAYEKEWEIFKLPGNITGFLILHIPIMIVLFYGALEIEKDSSIGLILAIISGIGGWIPFAVHKILVRRKQHFNRMISNIIIYANLVTGIAVVVLSISFIVFYSKISLGF